MAKVKITQVRSRINRSQVQKRTLDALGLRKMNQVVEHTVTPQIKVMIARVSHLIRVEEV
jgi:large subunit ribosomal protein L30